MKMQMYAFILLVIKRYCFCMFDLPLKLSMRQNRTTTLSARFELKQRTVMLCVGVQAWFASYVTFVHLDSLRQHLHCYVSIVVCIKK